MSSSDYNDGYADGLDAGEDPWRDWFMALPAATQFTLLVAAVVIVAVLCAAFVLVADIPLVSVSSVPASEVCPSG